MKLPPLNPLKAFETSARRGSFALAAAELGVTSAAVSLQVRKLEEYFDKTLFTRNHNSISLTDAGLAVYRGCAPAFTQLATLTGTVLGQPTKRPLCISVLPSLAERWLAPRLHSFDGGVRIRVEDDPVDMSRSAIDLRLTYGTQFYPAAHSTQLFHEQMVAVISTSHASANLALATIPETQFIHVEWGQYYYDHIGWNDWFTAIGSDRKIDPATGTQVTNASLALALADSGRGAALVHASLIENALHHGRLRLLHPQQLPLPRPYYAICSELPDEHSDLARLIHTIAKSPLSEQGQA